MRVRGMAPLAVLLLAGLVGGCSAGPDKQSAAASTPTASHRASEHAAGTVRTTATARSSAKPAVLDPKLAAEAEAFVRRFMAASDRAAVSGDFSDVKPLVAKDCEPCQASIAYFAKLYAGGGSVTGGEFVRPELSAQAAEHGGVKVTVEATIAAYTVKRSRGGRGTDYPAERVTYTYTVRRTEGAGWQVVGRSF